MKPDKPPMEKGSSQDEDCENGFSHRKKKQRLTDEQIQFLEKSFEVENKLESGRKNQLAKELNLPPKQVAVWFQNRRARHKAKHVENNYDSLQSSYDKLLPENKKLKLEVQFLKEKLVQREKANQDSLALESHDGRPNPIPIPIPNLTQNGTNVGEMVLSNSHSNYFSIDEEDTWNMLLGACNGYPPEDQSLLP